ncbi:MAG: cysteine desulfurase, cysteine desulfurase / selenocysteine lyase [candidate division WWE3 bacterium GW2011_GWC1_41_7]|uniref:Cysteine desulfurase n=4 Tax=Katanobacteria TaxID=422282 RepID=A0A0G0XDR1_UNCKA|nr:MAG: Cysteine desulfurase SufS [candidate division WWE3 bacterium GW2011_GWB1_41_6]KKS21514.1 MAG: cysteine desulfurase, cysteine desulfurase / selenocysteine lyase [candidate division WWE3 bacterium GW2011_GWC1_41_7]KKS22527.1 MAG: Cysteine desulfurase SufS [candidate division WWE3 bacterium GW2011_GWA1_41_8]OGC56927.1 MAG: hypothetical protein A2976_00755 [candidate division WWE3 bacterium RIFCSPLOWO2_01_FULL_41_9]
MNDFPILNRKINGKDLIYLDSAATSQKPVQVIDAVTDYYKNHNANVHRGVHTLGDESTELYEAARKRVASFIGAVTPSEIVFTNNATDSLNLVAQGWGLINLKKGDVVLTTVAEHNSNVLPWEYICERTGSGVEYMELTDEGLLDMDVFKSKLTDKVKVVVLSHASNVLGTILPVKQISELAKEKGALVVIDGSQAVPHIQVNVQSLGCDFYAFSGHKMLGPMGIGVLWGRRELLSNMIPIRFGGGMVLDVDKKTYELAEVPECFEGGTPDVAGAVGLAAAIDYLDDYGMENVRKHEIELTSYAIEKLRTVKGLWILGPHNPDVRTGLISFVIDGIHSHDVASILDSEGIAVRSGMHCAMNLHKNMQISSSTRASFYIYNTLEDIDKLLAGIEKAVGLLK